MKIPSLLPKKRNCYIIHTSKKLFKKKNANLTVKADKSNTDVSRFY